VALLEVDDVRAGYGRIEVLHGVSLRLEEHALCAIVGANGAGKSTLLLTLSRLLSARSGRIRFAGRDLTHAPSHAVVRAGLVHVPEGRRVLASMSVDENMLVAPRPPRRLRARDRRALRTLPDPAARAAPFRPVRSRAASSRCSPSRAALAMKPKALLLDEPSMGLAPKLVDQIFAIIAAERARGTSILLVEQNARRALASPITPTCSSAAASRSRAPGRELARTRGDHRRLSRRDAPALRAAPVGERRGLRERRAGLDHDVGVLREFDLARIAAIQRTVDVEAQARPAARAQRTGAFSRERLAPDGKEFAERKRADRRRLDVNQPVGRMRVQPVEAPSGQRPPDVARNRDGLAAVEQRQVLMDVERDPLGSVAVDAVHGLTARRFGKNRSGPDQREPARQEEHRTAKKV
jgi:branched-chain amino acid transport system ATP-binding protein